MPEQASFYSLYEDSSKVHLINHFKSLVAAAENHDVELVLEPRTFRTYFEIGSNVYTLYPQFLKIIDNEPLYTTNFSQDVVCFTGWRPYRPVDLPALASKIPIKEHMVSEGILTPAYQTSNEAIKYDFIGRCCINQGLESNFAGL